MIAELDGVVYHHKVAAFRVIPYFIRERIPLPKELEDMSGISKTTLRKLEDMDEYKKEVLKQDFNFENVTLTKGDNATALDEDVS